jgi:hypothetical protein
MKAPPFPQINFAAMIVPATRTITIQSNHFQELLIFREEQHPLPQQQPCFPES